MSGTPSPGQAGALGATVRALDVDSRARTHLANERTFLAWLRTGLALLAGAVALASLVRDFGPRPMRLTVTALLMTLSLTVTVGAYVRWDRAERAIRQKLPLPMDPMPRIMIGGAAVITAAVAVLIMLAESH